MAVAMTACRFELPDAIAVDSTTKDSLPAGPRTDGAPLGLCTNGTPGGPNCPINTIPLDNLGIGGIPGARITFIVQAAGGGIYLTDMRLVPGSKGAHIEHPLFFSIPSDPMSEPIVDPLDRFMGLIMNLVATANIQEQQIGGGTSAFTGFPASNKLAIAFKVAREL